MNTTTDSLLSSSSARRPSASPALRVGAAGFAATAVACGPARMGFGMFVPRFREEFGLDAATIGTIGSAAFLAALAGLLVVGPLTHRFGTLVPTLLGCAAAALGLVIVGASVDALTLGAGTALAALSSGLCWIPYNRAAKRMVPASRRDQVLSIVSTGTTFGIAAAGALALLAPLLSMSWRTVWFTFAALAVIAGLVNAFALPRRKRASGREGEDRDAAEATGNAERPLRARLGELLIPAAAPMHLAAFAFGLLYAVFLAFGVDRVVAQTDHVALSAQATGAWLFVAFGTAGIVGLATGNLSRRVGTERLVALAFLALALALGTLAFFPASLALALLAAALTGASTMIVCAALSFWSLSLYSSLPALGFNAVVVTLTLGSVVGPALAGAVHGAFGAAALFAAAAALSVLSAIPLFAWRRLASGSPMRGG